MITVHIPPRRTTRTSGNRNDVDFWRYRSKTLPIVILDGKVFDRPVCEAFAGSDGYGYVTVEVLGEDGLPLLANVVLPDGEVLDQVIARRTIHGSVTIIWPEPTQ
ncbi:hypothetical protein [Mesorhizobium sp. WSM3626]|uniref:hypothetical protein n=1 Tax=Mesorhizobium sp. WSM3626 TaxID=1040987 RepID=UPI00048A0E5E|nr:hypothetical protein [Mesorhizobium sp. WSM3626]